MSVCWAGFQSYEVRNYLIGYDFQRHFNLATDFLWDFTSIVLYIEPQARQGKFVLLSSQQIRWSNIQKKMQSRIYM